MADNKKVTVKNLDTFAEVEFCLCRYLNSNIKGIMKDVRKDLTAKQAKETADYEMSWRGMLGNFIDGLSGSFMSSNAQYLKAAGEWNSKTTEDYLKMCKDKVLKDKVVMHDITSLTVEWRNAIVKEIGQKRYDQASKTLGADLAAAYVDSRLQQMMMDVLIDEQTPKSTAEYIIRKGAEGSLIGFAHTLNRSDLDAQIAKEAEARYKANGWEWAGARATSFAVDTVSTMGFGSWSSLAKLAGFEVVMVGVEKAVEKGKTKDKTITIEECISQGVFGSSTKQNVFSDIKSRSGWIDAERSKGVTRINANLKRPVSTFSVGGRITRAAESASTKMANAVNSSKGAQSGQKGSNVKAQGNKTQTDKKEEKPSSQPQSKEAEVASRSSEAKGSSTPSSENPSEKSEDDKIRQEQEANQAGWSELMGELGFNGLGDIGHNLGYVIAMLPDILVGMLTGKTQSLHLRDNMIPMASVVAGMFVKSPILKTLLIGMGGMNLLNKAGHESLARHANPNGPRFKQYQDEPLNPRITNPIINGNTLVANIDKTPCSILLPDNVVAAHQAGALPLNTLANAVLAKHDAGSQMSQCNYRSVMQDNNLQNNRQLR